MPASSYAMKHRAVPFTRLPAPIRGLPRGDTPANALFGHERESAPCHGSQGPTQPTSATTAWSERPVGVAGRQAAILGLGLEGAGHPNGAEQ